VCILLRLAVVDHHSFARALLVQCLRLRAHVFVYRGNVGAAGLRSRNRAQNAANAGGPCVQASHQRFPTHKQCSFGCLPSPTQCVSQRAHGERIGLEVAAYISARTPFASKGPPTAADRKNQFLQQQTAKELPSLATPLTMPKPHPCTIIALHKDTVSVAIALAFVWGQRLSDVVKIRVCFF
jgi:hypothetical protein